MKKLSKLILGVIFPLMTFLSISAIAQPQVAFAADAAKADVCRSVGGTPSGTNCIQPAGSTSVNNVLVFVFNLLSAVAAIIAVIMMIISGMKFITSAGDPQGVASARKSVLYTAIGIVIVVLSQVIVRFVLNRATG